ncbi:MAG: hypothetical protein AVDCRST_MAG49-3834, partial [uncultured Thermomicrobiales bacterium]
RHERVPDDQEREQRRAVRERRDQRVRLLQPWQHGACDHLRDAEHPGHRADHRGRPHGGVEV